MKDLVYYYDKTNFIKKELGELQWNHVNPSNNDLSNASVVLADMLNSNLFY